MVGFKGGDLLKAYVNRAAKSTGKNEIVQVGFLENATYPDGTSVPLIAALNEFGVPSHGQPPRPFMRRAIEARAGAWVHNFGVALKATKLDTAKALGLVGQNMKDDIQQSIRDLKSPPLAPYTIKKKGFDKPLIETSFMLQSVAFRVTSGDEK